MEEDPRTFWNIIGGIATLTVVLHSASGQGGGAFCWVWCHGFAEIHWTDGEAEVDQGEPS